MMEIKHHSELRNIAGFPVITKQINDKTIVWAYDHGKQQFRLLVIDASKSVLSEIVSRWGFHVPDRMPTFSPPFRSAAITVTGYCNMNCPYCFVYPVPRKSNMTAEFAKTAVYALAEHMTRKHSQIYIWGGEPTQNPPALFSALDTISKVLGSNCTVTITTNGYVENSIIERAAMYNNVEFQISFDGTAQDEQKMISGGSYERVLQSIDLANRVGKMPILRLTITKNNVLQLKNIFRYIIENELTNRICIEPVHAYVGRSQQQLSSQPDAELYVNELFDCILYAEKNNCTVYSQPLRPLTTNKSYDWGFVNILPDGTAVLTVSIVDSSHPDTEVFLSGRIHNESLELSDNISKQNESFVAAVARNCVSCPLFSICKGNEQRDYFVHGSPMAEYRCNVFRHIMNRWMELMIEKAFIQLKNDGTLLAPGYEESFFVFRKPDQKSHILDVTVARSRSSLSDISCH